MSDFEVEKIDYYGNVMSYRDYLKKILNLDNESINSLM
jgi:hypothetical protein